MEYQKRIAQRLGTRTSISLEVPAAPVDARVSGLLLAELDELEKIIEGFRGELGSRPHQEGVG